MNIKIQSYFSKAGNHNPFVFNLILWLISFTILIYSFSEGKSLKKIDYIYTGCFLTTIILPVSINLYVLIPRFLKHEKYILYCTLFILNLIAFTQLNMLFFNHLIDFIFPEHYFISYHSNTKLITIFSVFLIGSTLVKLSEDWFYFNKNENRELKLKNQQIQTQLISLRSQINPHFLFNSLNVIYSLSLEKKETTKDAIVQLSNILRYIIYDSNTTTISLKDEISLLKNYIEFQKFRQHETSNVTFNKNINNQNYQIYPMLLLPLIENSFKHGIKGDINHTFIHIDIQQQQNSLIVYIENNYARDSFENRAHSGLGLKNIQQNLDLVYPKQHDLIIDKTDTTFSVTLKLF